MEIPTKINRESKIDSYKHRSPWTKTDLEPVLIGAISTGIPATTIRIVTGSHLVVGNTVTFGWARTRLVLSTRTTKASRTLQLNSSRSRNWCDKLSEQSLAQMLCILGELLLGRPNWSEWVSDYCSQAMPEPFHTASQLLPTKISHLATGTK